MADLELAGDTIAPIVEADTSPGDAYAIGTFYALAPLGNVPLEHDPEYDEMPLAFPGVDGVGTKNMGFRGRDIDIELIFLNSTESNIRTAKDTLIDKMAKKRFTVTVPGGTQRPSCKLKRGGARELFISHLGGRMSMKVRINVRSMKE